jgi:hypothetical protein
MKKTITLMLAVILSSAFVFAQDVPVPEFKNTPMILKSDGGLGKLEKQTGTTKQGGGGPSFGYGYGYRGNVGGNTFITLTEPNSPVKVSTSVVFIVKLTDEETDPEGVFTLIEAITKS